MTASHSPLPDVAFVCHAYHRGGVTRWMVDAAVAWRALGGRVWLVAPTPAENGRATHRPALLRLLLDTPEPRPEIVTWPVDVTFEFGTTSHRAFTYAKVIERHIPVGVPVIVSDDPAVWAGTSNLCARNPLIGVVHSDDPTYYDYVRHYRRELSGVVCVSRRTHARTAETLERSRLPLTIIPCGVPVLTGGSLPHRVTDDRPKIAWVGRMEEFSKRVSDLPKIARALCDAGVACQFDLVGDGPARQALVDEISRSGLAASITLHGWRDRDGVRSVLENADIFLMPSNFEGMSVALMEAMAAGCAIVSSRTSGIEDYSLRESAARCIWTFPVGDIAEAVHCVRSALAIPRTERQQRSRTFAQSEFSIERCVRDYAAFLGRIRPPAYQTPDPSRAIRAQLSAIASRPLAAWRNLRLARTAQ